MGRIEEDSEFEEFEVLEFRQAKTPKLKFSGTRVKRRKFGSLTIGCPKCLADNSEATQRCFNCGWELNRDP